MKILHISDIHNDLKPLETAKAFSDKEGIDLVVCTGDLAGPVYTEKESETLREIEGLVLNIHSRNGFKGTLEELTKRILVQENTPEDIRKLVGPYSGFIQKARKETTKQYVAMKSIFDSFNLPYLIVPGNWDTVNLLEVFGSRCLHYRNVEDTGEIEIVGFGGSPERMFGLLPVDTEFPFSSEMAYASLNESNEADIALTHCPPLWLADKSAMDGSSMGDLGVLAYYFRNKPSAILCGHTHNPSVARDVSLDRSYVICAGNLGRVKTTVDGDVVGNFGFFNTVLLDEGTFFKSANFYKIGDIEKGFSSLKEIAQAKVE